MNAVCINVNKEDKEHIQERVQEISVQLSFFSCFAEAKKYLELNLVDMVFLDITGINLNWMEQYNKIKLIDNAIIIILISDSMLEAVKAYEVGAFDFLLKPVKKKQLERVFLKAEGYLQEKNKFFT